VVNSHLLTKGLFDRMLWGVDLKGLFLSLGGDMNLIKLIRDNVVGQDEIRVRDRRAFYASDNDKCSRDLYLSLIGEPETNPPDFEAERSFFLGKAIEMAMKTQWLPRLVGANVLIAGLETPVGGSKPPWDGRVDFLLKDLSDKDQPLKVVEFKTIKKYGADKLFSAPHTLDKDGYIAQLGLYLKDFYDKGFGLVEGLLFFMGFSDKYFMQMLQYNVVYDPARCEACVVSYIDDGGLSHKMTKRVPLQKVLDKFSKVLHHVQTKNEPKPDYTYKHAVTEDSVKDLSDDMIRKVLKGLKIIGDWQPVYSRYRDRNFKVDNVSRSYTEDELDIFRREYQKRHPKSKL